MRKIKLLPEGKVGIAELTHFEVPEDYIDFSAISHGGISPAPGKYMRLCVNGTLMMSDTKQEMMQNWQIMYTAFGKVLIGGLGLGVVLQRILQRKEVDHVTVVEKYQDVIDLVGPHYRSKRVTLICDDVLTWKPPKGEKYQTIYFDIWPDACEDNLGQVSKLHRRFARNLDRTNKDSWMNSWMADELRARRRRDRSVYPWL